MAAQRVLCSLPAVSGGRTRLNSITYPERVLPVERRSGTPFTASVVEQIELNFVVDMLRCFCPVVFYY